MVYIHTRIKILKEILFLFDKKECDVDGIQKGTQQTQRDAQGSLRRLRSRMRSSI